MFGSKESLSTEVIETRNTQVEEKKMSEENKEHKVFDIARNICDNLNEEELKQLGVHCSRRLHELKKNEQIFDIVRNICNNLNEEEFKRICTYFSIRIDEFKNKRLMVLEKQSRAINAEMEALKNFNGNQVSVSNSRVHVPSIVNPNNHKQVYRFGKIPPWLEELKNITGKSVTELRAEAKEKEKEEEAFKNFNSNQVSFFNSNKEIPSIVNPNNHKQVYRFGKHPDWLKRLICETGKTVAELRQREQ